jgi:hypothetical protein
MSKQSKKQENVYSFWAPLAERRMLARLAELDERTRADVLRRLVRHAAAERFTQAEIAEMLVVPPRPVPSRAHRPPPAAPPDLAELRRDVVALDEQRAARRKDELI